MNRFSHHLSLLQMPVFALDENTLLFPDPRLANEDGLLAVGGKLSADWLLLAYENGIFPWFNEGDPILWWSVDPRSVLLPNEVHMQKSMRPYLNSDKFEFRLDTEFETVVDLCAKSPGRGKEHTWISKEMADAYLELHELGFAHSAEIWKGNELVGGLYGVSLGSVFFGESMFSLEKNMSKLALIRLANFLVDENFKFIDCQVPTDHLERMGAKPVERDKFLNMLKEALHDPTMRGQWKL